jgi:hypothetical protein
MKTNGYQRPFRVEAAPETIPMPHESDCVMDEPMLINDGAKSNSILELETLKQAIGSLPTIRADKVEELREAIANRTYFVETAQLTRKLVDEALSEALLRQLTGAR